jgi:hypothetical protein
MPHEVALWQLHDLQCDLPRLVLNQFDLRCDRRQLPQECRVRLLSELEPSDRYSVVARRWQCGDRDRSAIGWLNSAAWTPLVDADDSLKR